MDCESDCQALGWRLFSGWLTVIWWWTDLEVQDGFLHIFMVLMGMDEGGPFLGLHLSSACSIKSCLREYSKRSQWELRLSRQFCKLQLLTLVPRQARTAYFWGGFLAILRMSGRRRQQILLETLRNPMKLNPLRARALMNGWIFLSFITRLWDIHILSFLLSLTHTSTPMIYWSCPSLTHTEWDL